METEKVKHILLFDGVCNLCNGSVQFVIQRDPQGKFHFASLQSASGQQLLRKHHLSTQDFDSFVYIRGHHCVTKSTAALHLFKELGGLCRLLYGFIIIPRPLRDALYNWIAQNRYRWFGKQEVCMIPTPEIRERFLEWGRGPDGLVDHW